MLAYPGEYPKGEREADGRGQPIRDRLHQIVAFLAYENSDAEHGAIGRDERQEYSQSLIERRDGLFHDYLKKLHEKRNHEDENDGLEKLQSERIEHVDLQKPCYGSGQGDDESHGRAHSKCRTDLFRHP